MDFRLETDRFLKEKGASVLGAPWEPWAPETGQNKLKVQNKKYTPRDTSVRTAVSFLLKSALVGVGCSHPEIDFSHLPATDGRAESTKPGFKCISIGDRIPHAEGGSAGAHGETPQPPWAP